MTQRPNIRHVVFFSATNRADIQQIIDGLNLLADIPHSQAFEVRRNTQTDPISADCDVVLYAEFVDQDALTAYRAHPLYQKSIDIVRPLRAIRISADF